MEKKTILVIEDNELNLKLVLSLLKIGGYQALSAPDAESGVEIAREHRPDLILMDIQLPGMDGLDATRMLQQDERLRKIPVVALTSYAMQGDKEKAIEAGCVDYISKPVDTRRFLENIRPHMS